MENWKSIKNYENYYEVSDLGRVRSLDRVMITRTGKLLKRSGIILAQHPNAKNGFLQVMLFNHGRMRLVYTHRLVAEAFVKKSEDEMAKFVGHIDGNIYNNTPGNLIWQTMAQIIQKRDNKKTNTEKDA